MSTEKEVGRGRDRRDMMRGAGMAFLGRIGALIEAASFPLFLWLYGPVVFGLFATLWALLRMASGFTQMGMDVALPRFVPLHENDPDTQLRCLKIALIAAMTVGSLSGLALVLLAPLIAPSIEGADNVADTIFVIRVYAPVLPLWTLIEVLTAAIRSRRRFGPEIRIRFFYEQVLRILFAALFAFVGFDLLGLFLAHLLSAALSCVLAFQLLRRNYPLARFFSIAPDRALIRQMLIYALPMMPSTLIQRFISELPVVLLNILIPGSRGAAIAGYYSIARKISSVMQIIHNSFDYVIAPLAAFRKGTGDPGAIADMYGYSARLMIGWGALLASALVALGAPLMTALGPGAAAAGPTLVLLILGRYASFFFGQAPAILRTVAAGWWSLANGLAGLIVMILLILLLVADHGSEGAAIAAGVGLFVIRGLSFLELRIMTGMTPYDRRMTRPLLLSMTLAGLTIAIGRVVADQSLPLQILVVLLIFGLSIPAFLRYGLSDEDANAFGGLARRLRRGR
ncbi:MAG: hypothetical protein Tsb008_10860 [Rhodothalassiaceae bacterium]